MNNNQDMTTREIANLCEAKQSQLLSKYFGNLVHEAAIERPETIGEYTKDLPLKIEAEFRTFLEDLWQEHAPVELKGTPLILEEQDSYITNNSLIHRDNPESHLQKLEIYE